MATRTGAAAIRMADSIGQLKVGMQADLIQLDISKTRHQPLYDVISHLVYMLDNTDVVTTVVAGKVLMEDRQVKTIDESRLRRDVDNASAKIRAALAEQEAGA